jgi:hypothetical protein
MVQRKAAAVLVHDGEGRTAHVGRRVDAKSIRQPSNQEGFACAKLAAQRDYIARMCKSSDRFPKQTRLLG